MNEKTDQELIDAVEEATRNLYAYERESDEQAIRRACEVFEVVAVPLHYALSTAD